MDASLLEQLQAELELGRAHGHSYSQGEEHTDRWNDRFSRGQRRLIRDDGQLDPDALRDFRRLQLFTGDNPQGDPSPRRLANWVHPGRRRERQLLRRLLRILEKQGYDDLLAKYPSPSVGNPYLFVHGGRRYTHRWFKHVYSLGLLRKVLRGRLEAGFTSVDIGGAYGIFQGLLHQEYPGSHHVLVDLPEQLLLASYFLREYLPSSRIAGIAELAEAKTITREFIASYDFVLMPPGFYEQIAPGSVDLVTSFAALGELKRAYFDYYVNAEAFRTARFLATANPVVSSRMFPDSDVSVLDYPIWDPAKRLHFDIARAYLHPYDYPTAVTWRSLERQKAYAFFEYVGEISS